MRTPDSKFTKVHGAKCAEDAATALKAANTSIDAFIAGTTNADKMESILSKMSKEDAKMFRSSMVVSTSPDDFRVKSYEAYKRIRGAILANFMPLTADDFANMEPAKANDALKDATKHYNANPQSFPSKVLNA